MKIDVLILISVILYSITATLADLQKIHTNVSNVPIRLNRYRRQFIEQYKRRNKQEPEQQISCTLPPHPENGRWTLLNSEGVPGDKIKASSILQFHCKKGYKLSSKSSYVVCDRKWNSANMPECLKLCPPMHSTPTTIVKCIDKHENEIGCEEATEDSYLSYSCASFYEAPFGYKTTFRCSDGDWSSPHPVCQPICGKKVHDDTRTLIYGGKIETVIEYPWIVALYTKINNEYQNICGGSILSQRLVLTAAHCVTNQYGDALPAENYMAVGGKLYNKYEDHRDPKAQYLEVFEVKVHSSYKGNSRRYLADIAIIITKQQFVFNDIVQPVCFNDLKNINLQVGTTGVVAGWGVSESGIPSDELRTLEIPYKSEATCAQELPGDWGDRYNVIDKLCAGLVNQSMSICRGDSGGGLFFKNTENNRYYVHGIVSLGHSLRGQCNIQQNSLYTKVAFHYDFVDRLITKYYIKDCTLPPHPENGQWVISGAGKKPGDSVPSDTILNITCEDGYKLSSDRSRIKCESSFVMPTCQRLCPDVKLGIGIDFECKSKEGDTIKCSEATDLTTLSFTCPSHYKIPDGAKNTRKCKKGVWELPTPSCQPTDTTSATPEKEEPSTKVICMYDSSQRGNGVEPEDLNATLCTHVVYDSVALLHDGNLRVSRSPSDNEGNKTLYHQLADMKKTNRNLKVLLGVHGLGNKETDEFPVVAADATKKTTLITSIVNFLETYHFDGLNLHWDLPTYKYKEKFITLLRELNEALKPRGWIFTATVYYAPTYLGYDDTAMKKYLDWINIACYGLYAEWSRYTGQNSALYASSLESADDQEYLNVYRCGHNWELYGIPKNKIVLSIAFFGRYYTLKDESKHGIHAPVTGSTDANDTDRITYAEICQKYTNWTRVWDDQQKNPYKYYKNKWVGYDDKDSVKFKAEFIKENNYLGAAIFPVNGDDIYGKCGPRQLLLKQVNAGLNSTVDTKN